MSLLDDIRTAQSTSTVGGVCGVRTLLERLAEEERADLLKALDDVTINHAAIARALELRGAKIGASSIGRHRKGQCRCRDRGV